MVTMSTPIQLAEANDKGTPDIPSLVFDNRTEFDALHFDALDQYAQAFHVIVAKTGYTLGACNHEGETQLIGLDEPVTLEVEDKYYEDRLACSVRQESDLAPFKPCCDVIVNAEAYAPRGKSARHFNVRLIVQKSDGAALLPEPPQPLNPIMPVSQTALNQWQREVETVKARPLPDKILIDKTLTVTGPRRFKQKRTLTRFIQWIVKWGTLTLVRPNPWKLTGPQAFSRMPLRYEFAEGGQCRIEPEDKAARKINKKHRLPAEQRAEHPDRDAPPIAHEACESNPVGFGFVRRWYQDALRLKEWPAPRIEYPARPMTAKRFRQVANGNLMEYPAGMGFIGRAWLPRRTRIGHFERKSHWNDDEVPSLPEDFDFRYWNGAPEDQQCAHLTGGERFTLTNLCPHDALFAKRDTRNDTVLSFSLPRQALFVLGAGEDGHAALHQLAIDTVVIDPEAGQVDLVWRVALPADGDIIEARLIHANTEEQLKRLSALQTPPPQKQDVRVSDYLTE